MPWKPYPVTDRVRITTFYSIFEIAYEDGCHFPGETHPFWECLYVVRGSACVSGDGRVFQLAEGDLIFHKPLELHKFYIDHPDGARLFIFSFHLEGDAACLQNKAFSLNEEQTEILHAWRRYLQRELQKVKSPQSMSAYTRYLLPFGRTDSYAQMVGCYASQLLLSLLDGGSVAPAVMTTAEAQVFQQAVHFLSAHVDGNPSVSALARYCHMSDSSLKRLFQKYAGMSVHKYFLKLKFNAAAQLLQSGVTVSEAAERLGFCTPSYFSVSCKRELGVSPSQLQKQAAVESGGLY